MERRTKRQRLVTGFASQLPPRRCWLQLRRQLRKASSHCSPLCRRVHGERRTAFPGCLKRRRAQSAQVLNQVSTTLLGLAVVYFGGLAVLMRPVERSIGKLEAKVGAVETKVDEKVGALETKVGALETKVGAVETKVGGVETKVDSLALVTKMTLVLTILGSAASVFRSSGLQLPV